MSQGQQFYLSEGQLFCLFEGQGFIPFRYIQVVCECQSSLQPSKGQFKPPSQPLGNNSETSRKTLGASRKPFGPQSDKPAALSEAVDMYMVLLLDICIQSAA